MFVPSAISQSIPDQCNTNSAINLAPFTANQGIWSGQGIVGSMFVPNSVGSGSFILTHSTATSPSGLCPNSSTTSVRVYSLQTPSITKVNTMCNNASPIQLIVEPVGGIFGGINTGGISLKGLFNPALGVIGKNIVTYSISSGPCIAFAQSTIDVEQFVSAKLSNYPKDYYCLGADGPFNLNSFVTNPGGSWFGPGVVGNMFHPNKANLGINNLVYMTHSIPSQTLCPDEEKVIIKVVEIQQPTVSLTNQSGCVPLQVIFNSNMINGSGTWKFSDGSKDENGLFLAHTFTSSGTYTAFLSFTSQEGCSANTQTTSVIKVYELPKPDFNLPKEVYISNPEIQTINKTQNLAKYTYTWNVSNGVTGNPVNLLFTPEKIGRYEVTLTVKSVDGCTATTSKFVDVKNEFNVYIPNSFTPNEDGLNDYFTPVFSDWGFNTNSYRMEIFDRWGQLLYETTEISKGWNGTVKGELCKEGAYVYKLRIFTVEGVLVDRIGSFLLIRN